MFTQPRVPCQVVSWSAYCCFTALCWAAAFSQEPDTDREVKAKRVIIGYTTDGKRNVQEDVRQPYLSTVGELPKGLVSKSFGAVNPDCGVNALYLLIRASGRDCNLIELRSVLPLTNRGASFLDLKQVAAKYDLDAVVLECHPDELKQRLPLIARLRTAEHDTGDNGHFVLLTRIDDDDVVYVDGSDGSIVSRARSGFEKQFSGHVLVENSRVSGATLVRMALVAAIAVELVLVTWLAVKLRLTAS